MSAPAKVPPLEKNKSIGVRIRLSRKAKGMPQDALATRLGVSQPTVANWEADVHNPRQLMLAKLAEALDVSLGWLAGGEEADAPQGRQPALRYLAKPLYHAPVLPTEALQSLDLSDIEALHAAAIDFVPVTGPQEDLFAAYLDPSPYSDAFPRDALFVFSARTEVTQGAYVLVDDGRSARLHRMKGDEAETGTLPNPLGVLVMTARFF